MVKTTILSEVLNELKRAKKVHPQWPEHIVAKAAICCEEAGELVRACLIWKYERASHGSKEYFEQFNNMRKEAIHTASTALRFLENLDNYDTQSKRSADNQTSDIGEESDTDSANDEPAIEADIRNSR